jgi:hypothetical protein
MVGDGTGAVVAMSQIPSDDASDACRDGKMLGDDEKAAFETPR